MRMIVPAAIALLAACRHPGGEPGFEAAASLRDAAGAAVGSARFVPSEGGVELEIEAYGLAPGPHGMHIHERGLCEPPSFESAGGHLNPSLARHGLGAAGGPHAGDMPNLVVDADGKAKVGMFLAGVTLGPGERSLLRSGGAALVIHAGPDDQVADPSGNSGARVACGVIGKRRLTLKRVLTKVNPVPR